jgi:GNAT superfamily N-acetyltransferase
VTAPARPSIRFATETDIDTVAHLICAMDTYYEEALPDESAYAAMVASTLATQEGTRFVLCFSEGEPAGIACFAILRPGAHLSGLIFVKDLFVRAEWRGRGLGRALMRFIARFARDQGIGRIDLATDQNNHEARRLYEALGGVLRPAVYFTFPESALKKMAGH